MEKLPDDQLPPEIKAKQRALAAAAAAAVGNGGAAAAPPARPGGGRYDSDGDASDGDARGMQRGSLASNASSGHGGAAGGAGGRGGSPPHLARRSSSMYSLQVRC